MKANVLVLLVLGCASVLAACSTSKPSPGEGGAGGTGGESATGGMNGTGGMTGTGGAGGDMTGGGGTGGGMAGPNAKNLGAPCGGMPAMPCPNGEICVIFAQGMPGFCTIPCDGDMDTTTCSAANGYTGPGSPQCTISIMNPMTMMTTPGCGVLCGAQFNLPDTCPGNLTCQDKLNAMNMSGTDGKNDFCVP